MANFKQHVDRTYYKERMPIAAKAAYAQGIATGLTTYATLFTSPPHTPMALQASGNALAVAEGNYETTKSRVDKSTRDSAQTSLLHLLDDMATYVDGVADGDPDVIAKSGFNATRATGTPTTVPVAQGAVQHDAKVPGELQLGVKKVGKVDAFVYVAATAGLQIEVVGPLIKITTATGGHVYVQCSTHEQTVMQGLEPEKLQAVIVPVNIAGAGPATTGITATVQG